MRGWAFCALGLALLGASGCDIGFGEGISRGRGTEESTARSVTETELIPNTIAYVEDASPDWPLGRIGFRAGADQLLVVTHITSLDKRDEDGEPMNQRYDKYIERVWITIPLGTPLHQTLKVEDLDVKHLIGYDVAELGVQNDRFFVHPCTILGKVTLVTEDAHTATIDLDIQATPQDMPAWGLRQIAPVRVTTTGIRATLADLRGNSRPLAPTSQPAATQPAVAAPAPGTTVAPATTAPAATQSAGPAVKHSLVGRWVAHRLDPAGTEVRAQFDADGTCVLTTQTGGGSVLPRYGRYDLKGDYVIIHVERTEPQLEKMRYVLLHVVWSDTGPLLQGDLGPDPALHDLRLPLEQGNFRDMNFELPAPVP
jgi:hypothetical protein